MALKTFKQYLKENPEQLDEFIGAILGAARAVGPLLGGAARALPGLARAAAPGVLAAGARAAGSMGAQAGIAKIGDIVRGRRGGSREIVDSATGETTTVNSQGSNSASSSRLGGGSPTQGVAAPSGGLAGTQNFVAGTPMFGGVPQTGMLGNTVHKVRK